jgi:hypothetical protein
MSYSIHRWLIDLEHTACGLPHPHAVRGWREVTCQRCLGSIHAKLAQWQRQQSDLAMDVVKPRLCTVDGHDPNFRLTCETRGEPDVKAQQS